MSVAGMALLVGAAPDRSMQPVAGDPVTTTTGKVAGTQLGDGVRAYLGVAFAAPPTGPLRWAAPQPMSWSGVWNADRKGPACIQVLRPHDINHYFGEEPTSEDCLYANIRTTAKAGEKRPVVVFIYGGGLTIGSSGMANYDGAAMAKAGAVFVNFNYRVGAFGFLAHPGLTAEQGGHSGNDGLMDQIAALKWIRANIDKFGGDPDKVLIMGQSAGARSVSSLIFSPQAKGLFRAAAMSSGCSYTADAQNLQQAEQTGVAFQKALGVADLNAMRQLPADRILAAQSENQLGLRVQGVRLSGFIVDGYTMPKSRTDLLAAGEINRVPIVAGYNAADIGQGFDPVLNAETVEEYQEGARKLYGAEADAFLKLYPVKSDADVRETARRAAMEAGFESNARTCAREEAKLGQAAYLYNYTRVHPYVPGVTFADQDPATVGAYHTADIPYWFGTQDAYNWQRPTRNWGAWDRTMSRQMMAALIAFADTGSPNTAAMPWPAWTAGSERKLVLGDTARLEPLAVPRINWLAAHPYTRAAPTGPTWPKD